MTKASLNEIWLVNEHADGSGRWLGDDHKKHYDLRFAVSHVNKEWAVMDAENLGGHAIRFVRGEQLEERNWADEAIGYARECGREVSAGLERLIRDVHDKPHRFVQFLDDWEKCRAEEREPDCYVHALAASAMRQHSPAYPSTYTERGGGSAAYPADVPVYLGNPPPAPTREPDVIGCAGDPNSSEFGVKPEALCPSCTSSWPTKDVVLRLVEFAEAMLHDGYDAHGWEELHTAVKHARAYLNTPTQVPEPEAPAEPDHVRHARAEAERLVREGWVPHPDVGWCVKRVDDSRNQVVNTAVVDAMRAILEASDE